MWFRKKTPKPNLYSIQITYNTEKEEISIDIHVVDESEYNNVREVDLNRMLPIKYRTPKKFRDQSDSLCLDCNYLFPEDSTRTFCNNCESIRNREGTY